MKKVKFTVGLPGSGKSTWTREQVEAGKGKVKRVNKDDLRAMLDNSKYTPKDEIIIESILCKIIDHLIWETGEACDTVIVDSCMFRDQIDSIKEFITVGNNDIAFEEVVFDVTPEECIKRQKSRPEKEQVPEVAIWALNKRYEKEGRKFRK